MEASYLIRNASSHRNNLIKLTHCYETKKMTKYSQIVRAKTNLKLNYGWPSQIQDSGINQQIKVLCQGRRRV